ncbi:MAG: hypothetical protein U0169_10085 [Polyangiaceae bacterium]
MNDPRNPQGSPRSSTRPVSPRPPRKTAALVFATTSLGAFVLLGTACGTQGPTGFKSSEFDAGRGTDNRADATTDGTTPFTTDIPKPDDTTPPSATPPSEPECKPTTCAAIGANCGPIADGCGGLVECGTCTAPEICGGDGTANVCGGA